MLHIFQYNNVNGKVELEKPEILLISEFKALVQKSRNVCDADKTGEKCIRAFKEFTYIWLALDWQSLYAGYTEQERHEEALKDSGLTEEEFNDPLFRAACRKYRALQESNRTIRMLHAAQLTVDKFIDYFNNIDPEERDVQTGKPIFKVKDIMAEISNLSKVHEELKTLEAAVKKEMEEASQLRAGAVEGYLPSDF